MQFSMATYIEICATLYTYVAVLQATQYVHFCVYTYHHVVWICMYACMCMLQYALIHHRAITVFNETSCMWCLCTMYNTCTYDSEFRLLTVYVMVHACMLQPCGVVHVHVYVCLYVHSRHAVSSVSTHKPHSPSSNILTLMETYNNSVWIPCTLFPVLSRCTIQVVWFFLKVSPHWVAILPLWMTPTHNTIIVFSPDVPFK